jgi:hypothetical protein
MCKVEDWDLFMIDAIDDYDDDLMGGLDLDAVYIQKDTLFLGLCVSCE